MFHFWSSNLKLLGFTGNVLIICFLNVVIVIDLKDKILTVTVDE